MSHETGLKCRRGGFRDCEKCDRFELTARSVSPSSKIFLSLMLSFAEHRHNRRHRSHVFSASRSDCTERSISMSLRYVVFRRSIPLRGFVISYARIVIWAWNQHSRTLQARLIRN